MARDGSFGGGGGRVDALLPNPTILLETTLIYFLVSKIIPWVKADLTCAGYGGIHWAVIVVLFVVGFLCNARLSGSWILAAIGSPLSPALCLAINPQPLRCTGLFGDVKDDQQTFFLEGQVIITAIAAILFGIISIRIIAVGRNHADDSNPYQQVNEL